MGEEILRVELPNFVSHVLISNHRRPVYRTTPSGEMEIKNKLSVGKPRFWKISGQSLIVGIDGHLRNKVFRNMKEYLNFQLKGLPPITHYPISIEAEMHELPGLKNWDISNKSIVWFKNFEDCLQASNIIKDDNVSHVKKSGGLEFVPVENEEDRKLVFKVYKDEYLKPLDEYTKTTRTGPIYWDSYSNSTLSIPFVSKSDMVFKSELGTKDIDSDAEGVQ